MRLRALRRSVDAAHGAWHAKARAKAGGAACYARRVGAHLCSGAGEETKDQLSLARLLCYVPRTVDETRRLGGSSAVGVIRLAMSAQSAVSAIIVLAVVGRATGLEAHLPTGVLWCRGYPRARAPALSLQVDKAAQIDEEWFPAGADEETLKKHFRKLAAREHPDVSTAPDADDRFQTLTAEYTRLMQECRNGAARLELAQAWASLGGAYLAVSIAFNDPALSALITTALGSIKFAIDASNAEGHRYAPWATA